MAEMFSGCIFPETKQQLSIVINRSSFIEPEQALKIIEKFRKIDRRFSKAKYDGHKKIGLQVLDCSISLYQVPGLSEVKKIATGCFNMSEVKGYGKLTPIFDARVNH